MILNAYKENWEEILKELTALKEEMKVERKKEEPFFDLISSLTGNESVADNGRIQLLTEKVLSILKESAQIKNFWTKSTEIRKMEGCVEEELIFSGYGSIREKAGELTAELMKLAKNREAYLR
jgi:hypothetical protein